MNDAETSFGGDWMLDLMPHFLEQTKNRLIGIESQRQAIQDGRNPIEAMKAIGDIAHKISGTADTFGFVDLGAHAQQVEDVCLIGADRLDDPIVTWSQMERVLIPLIEEMARVLKPI